MLFGQAKGYELDEHGGNTNFCKQARESGLVSPGVGDAVGAGWGGLGGGVQILALLFFFGFKAGLYRK